MSDSYFSKPQREEYFVDSGYYKYHEAYHLLKFTNERQILEKAYSEYMRIQEEQSPGEEKSIIDLSVLRTETHKRGDVVKYGEVAVPFPGMSFYGIFFCFICRGE